MVHLIHKPSWKIHESQTTPEDAYLNRRSIIKAAGLGLLSSAVALGSSTITASASAAAKTADLYPAKRNEAFKLDREITPEEINSTYNNFYEFGSHKRISKEAQALVTDPWDIQIDGLVAKEQTISFDDLIRKMQVEERLYRHRCVEAWSMTVPWTGFPLSALVAMAEPTADAKYIRFETFLDKRVASGQRQVWYPWPYVEGVTIEEAKNDLAFMVTGAYGKPLANQFGAPLRLALPWKYGFKSIKSIKRITFTDQQPKSFWEQILGEEYGFWANVNPEVPHRRWSQAEERILHTDEKVPTLLYNGYEEQVAGLYKDMDSKVLFY